MKLKIRIALLLCAVLLSLTGCSAHGGRGERSYPVEAYRTTMQYYEDFKILQIADLHLGYSVGAERIAAPEAGMFFLCAGTARERAAAALEEMRREMRRLRGGRISAEELLGAKTRLCVALRSGRQRASSRCGNAALNALCGLPADRDAEAESRIGALTADDVARFANETLAEEFSLALTVFPPE